MITEQKIKIKLQKFLNREPTENEIKNGEKDYNIIQQIIIDELAEQNKMILELQAEVLKLKK